MPHTFVNMMFYFFINASIVTFLSNHISFGILMITFFKICFKIFKKRAFLKFKNLIIHHSLVYFGGHLVCVIAARDLRESYITRVSLVPSRSAREREPWARLHPSDMIEITHYVKYNDVRRDSMINFMLAWHKLSFLIGHFEV